MSATILDGRVLAKKIQQELQHDVSACMAQYGFPPHLIVVQVEGDEASERYVRSIGKLCEKVGMAFSLKNFPADISQDQFEKTLHDVSRDDAIHGVLVEMPLPKHLSIEQAVMYLDYRKDVDGIHPINAGLLAMGRSALVPNTPVGGMALLQHYNIPLIGRRAAMVGHSAIVGRPMAALLLQANATVTICHAYTKDLGSVLRENEIVLVAVGRAGIVTGDMLRPGAIVIDFGINVLADGTIVGDVDFGSAFEVARAITPVPGGTGPVTNVMLLRNVLTAMQKQVSL